MFIFNKIKHCVYKINISEIDSSIIIQWITFIHVAKTRITSIWQRFGYFILLKEAADPTQIK